MFFVRAATLQAIHRHRERVFNPDRKDHHWRLLQRAVNRVELRVEVSTNVVDGGDDRERNAGSDQAVFNGGGARLIVQEMPRERSGRPHFLWAITSSTIQ